ncbi:MAG: M56 family metallopeptidase [Puia sp.]|nr:M56 family metallopeptidase [Puia sp.]
MHLFTHSALLKALGWSLLDSMWQMALLWLLYLLATVLLKAFHKNSNAGLHHGLAILVLSIGTVWSGISFVRHFFTETAPPNISSAFTDLSVNLLPYRATGIDQYSLLVKLAAWMDQAVPVLSGLYLGILFFLMVRYLFQYYRSGLLRTQGLSKADPGLRLFVDSTRRSLGIHRQVGLWLSSLVEAPLTIGFFKPVILLPLAVLNNLDPKQVEAILLHELAHIRRNDYLLNLLMTMVQHLFFFNPFARLLVQHISKEREHSCDDLVMQFRYEPHSYASALLLLARSYPGNQRLAMAATGPDDGLLLQRVKRILKLGSGGSGRVTLRSMKKPALCLFLASLAACCSLFRSSSTIFQSPSTISSGGQFRRQPVVGTVVPRAETAILAVPVLNKTTAIVSVRKIVKVILPAHENRALVSIRKPHQMPFAERVQPNFPGTPPPGAHIANDNIAVSSQPEIMDFSIQLPARPRFPGSGMQQGQPFVPASSFSYLLTGNDGLIKGFSREQIAGALQLLSMIDWNRVQSQLSEAAEVNPQNTQNLQRLKMQVLQKLLELSRVYHHLSPDKDSLPKLSLPETKEIPGNKSGGQGAGPVIIVHI